MCSPAPRRSFRTDRRVEPGPVCRVVVCPEVVHGEPDTSPCTSPGEPVCSSVVVVIEPAIRPEGRTPFGSPGCISRAVRPVGLHGAAGVRKKRHAVLERQGGETDHPLHPHGDEHPPGGGVKPRARTDRDRESCRNTGWGACCSSSTTRAAAGSSPEPRPGLMPGLQQHHPRPHRKVSRAEHRDVHAGGHAVTGCPGDLVLTCRQRSINE